MPGDAAVGLGSIVGTGYPAGILGYPQYTRRFAVLTVSSSPDTEYSPALTVSSLENTLE